MNDRERLVHAIEDLTAAIDLLAAGDVVEPDTTDPVDTESTSGTYTRDSPRDTPHPNEADSFVQASEVVDYLGEHAPQVVEKVDVWDTEHGEMSCVAVMPTFDMQEDSTTWGVVKGVLGAHDDDSPIRYHLGFGDDDCYVCGENDGEFWAEIPCTAREVVEE